MHTDVLQRTLDNGHACLRLVALTLAMVVHYVLSYMTWNICHCYEASSSDLPVSVNATKGHERCQATQCNEESPQGHQFEGHAKAQSKHAQGA